MKKCIALKMFLILSTVNIFKLVTITFILIAQILKGQDHI